jgi:biopolymer transport protein ExbD
MAIGTFLLFLIMFLSEWQTKYGGPKERSLIVKIPPARDAGEQRIREFWQFRQLLFSYEDFIDAPPAARAEMLKPIEVSITEDGTIKVNSKIAGNLKDTKPLRLTLSTTFRLRDEYDINILATRRRARGVTLSAPLSARYGEVCVVLDVLKESGADPIVLQIDGLPSYEKQDYGR